MTILFTPGARADQLRVREETTGAASGVNVAPIERLASSLGGAGLIVAGLKRGGVQGTALALLGGALAYRGVSGHCELYESLNTTPAGKSRRGADPSVHRGLKVQRTFTVNRSPRECYDAWRDFATLPTFMTHLESVHVLDETRSRWTAKGPLGPVSWVAEIIKDEPGEIIAWRSRADDADIDHAGSVRFRPAPGNRGTIVTVALNYEPPAGLLGVTVARLLGEDPDTQVYEDLRHFKQIMEAGEIPTVAGQSSCRGCGA